MKKHSLPNGFLTAIKHYSDMVTKHGRDSFNKRRILMEEWCVFATTPVDNSNLVRFKVGA